jgi:hypothetical protein
MSRRLALALALGTTAGVGSVFGFSGCVGNDAVTDAICPPIEDFRPVSAVIEQRCGTLDCHGDPARPLKIYGRIGLRAPIVDPDSGIDADNYYSGGQEQTTNAELELNYRSICGLEPEIITGVVSGETPVGDLTLVRKPRLQEKHKGGKIWDEGKPGDRCVVKWLENKYEPGGFDPVDCNTELSR